MKAPSKRAPSPGNKEVGLRARTQPEAVSASRPGGDGCHHPLSGTRRVRDPGIGTPAIARGLARTRGRPLDRDGDGGVCLLDAPAWIEGPGLWGPNALGLATATAYRAATRRGDGAAGA